MQNSTLKLFCCPSNNQRRPVQEVGALGPWMTTCRDTNCTHTYISHINIFLNQENWLNYIQCMKYMNMKHPAPMPIHAMTCSKNKVYEVQNISNCHWLFSVLTVMTFLSRIRNKISHYSEQTCCSHQSALACKLRGLASQQTIILTPSHKHFQSHDHCHKYYLPADVSITLLLITADNNLHQ